MRKKSIMVLCNKLTGGGIQKVMQDVANYFASKPEKYTVSITVLESPERQTDLIDSRVKIYGVFRSKASYKKYSIAWFWYIFRRSIYCVYMIFRKYDVLLVLKDGWYFKLGGYLRANKKIAWFHTASSVKGQEHWTRIFFRSNEEERKCANTYDSIICVTEFERRQVVNQLGEMCNLIVRYNPIDVNTIRNRAKKETIFRSVIHPLFVVSNRLTPIKCTLRVLQSLERLQTEYEFSLWILGDGEERGTLENYVKEHEIKNVSFLGWQNNPYSYIAFADWFISASEYETFGLNVHEALALNIPCLVTDLPVYVECVSPQKAIIVDNSLEGIFKGIQKILKNPQLHEVYSSIQDVYTHEQLYTMRLRAIEELVD